MRLHLIVVPLIALAACDRPDPPRRAEAATDSSVATSLPAARERGAGARAALSGVVTVPSGAVDAGFAMQEGKHAIYVAADSGTRVVAGQAVRVAGRLADRNGFLVVVPDTVRVVGRTDPFPAYHARTRRVGEATEAMLLAVEGRITSPVADDRPYGWKFMIDDGSGPLQVFVPAHHPFDPASITPGKTLQVEGMSAQYDSTYEVIATQPLQLVP